MNPIEQNDYQGVVQALKPIWAEMLDGGNRAVTEETNFFEAGGHSLSAMLLVNRVKLELGRAVPLFALVENPTISAFSRYILSTKGADVVQEAKAPDGSMSQSERLLRYNEAERQDKRNRWFEKYYATAMGSAAHAEFCRQVYGENFGQHGMADSAQIDRLLDLLQPKEGDVVLDLGCGYGLISQYIAERTGAKVVGVDLSPSAIRFASSLAEKNDKLQFHEMDIRDLQFAPGTFTHIVSIDTIYYAPSLKDVLERFKQIGRPDVRLGIVRTFPIRSFTRDTWSPHLTELALLLKDLFEGYQTVDLSREENEHWSRKVEVLEALKERFVEEGNEELFRFRHEEATYEAGIEQFRYIFAAGL